MKGQTEEIRKSAVSAYKDGQSSRVLSEIFRVTSRTITRWVKEAECGQSDGKKRGHRPRCLSVEEIEHLDELVREHPDRTLAELRDDLNKQCSLPTIMLSSIRLGGITACLAIEGGTSSEVFREYVKQILVPTLRPGDVVVADNLSSHKDSKAKEAIEAAGA